MTPDAITAKVQSQIRDLVDVYPQRTCLKSVLAQVGRKMDLTYGQVKRLYYGEWRRIPADIFCKVDATHTRHLERLTQKAEQERATYLQLQLNWNLKWQDSAMPSGSGGFVAAQTRACEKPSDYERNQNDAPGARTLFAHDGNGRGTS